MEITPGQDKVKTELCLFSCPDEIFQSHAVIGVLGTSLRLCRRGFRLRSTFLPEAAGEGVCTAGSAHSPEHTSINPHPHAPASSGTGQEFTGIRSFWTSWQWETSEAFSSAVFVGFPWSHSPLAVPLHPVPHCPLPQQSVALSLQNMGFAYFMY